ncbi:MAG: hypothetical protein NWF08_01545 [Candidatus Bathyarchaeota archaeon]|nr:hypothetical protein [Candidatus Bathyarchaeota archaeon]
MSGSDMHENSFSIIICSKCGNEIRVLPPDDKHNFAVTSEEEFQDNIKTQHECPVCKNICVLFWGSISEQKLDS